MSRVVIDIRRGDLAGNTFRVALDEPRSEGGPTALELPFQESAPEVSNFRNGTGTMSEIGTYLLNCLRSHPAIDQAINEALALPPVGPPRPVFVRMPPTAEGLPWEALFAQSGFLSLDQRWPVARMGFESDLNTRVLDFRPPLRVMVVLAAAGVEARPEWDAVFEALRRLPVPVAIDALVAEGELHDHISNIADPNVDIDVSYATSAPNLIAAIREARPNILHVFSHGRVEKTSPFLLIATRDSWPDGSGDVVLEPRELADPAARESLWLATMNCCHGAQATASGSLVYGLLWHGFPAVAGMREAVSAGDAHAFARGFYGALVDLLQPLAATGQEVELDLTRALHRPRMAICDQHRGDTGCSEAAPNNREWTLPVLYVRSGGIVVRNGGQAPVAPTAVEGTEEPQASPDKDQTRLGAIRLETQLRLLRDLVDSPLPGTPPSAVDQIDAQIVRLERMLYAGELVDA